MTLASDITPGALFFCGKCRKNLLYYRAITETKPASPYFTSICHDYESKGRGFESRRAHFPEALKIKRSGDFFVFSGASVNAS